MLRKKVLKIFMLANALMLVLTFSTISFAEEGTEAPVKKKMTASQIAFIVKFDKNEDGKLDNKEFTGSHFPTYDSNNDGFIDVHEAPEGATAY